LSADPDIQVQFADDFSLRKMAYLLGDYELPPIGHFDPAGKWRQSYAMFVSEGPAATKVGEVSLERAPKGEQNFTLTVRTRRFGNSGFSQFEQAELQCRTDALATPTSWTFDTKMARDGGDEPYLESGNRRNAAVVNGALAVRDKWRTAKTEFDGPYSNEWTLLEAVQRLPGEQTRGLDFTLIEDYDTPQPGHRLAYRGNAKVKLRSGPEQLTGYFDLGRALVPTTYWVDEHHRLLFVCSGLMVYALSATDGQAGHCPDRYTAYQDPANPAED
jgi:hypothetical protein